MELATQTDLPELGDAPRRVGTRLQPVVSFVLRFGIYLVFLALVVVVALSSPVFLTTSNLSNVLLQSSVIGIIAVGMTFVIIVRGIDVSVGAVVALGSAVGVSSMILWGQPWPVGIALILLTALGIGAVNGLSSAYIGMPSFLVTLATLTMARGVVLAISGGQSLYGLPPVFGAIGLGRVFGIPVPVVVMVAAVLIGHLVLSRTVFGRYVYAVGGNPDAARVSGIPVRRIVFAAFLIGGFCAGLSSLVLTARFDSFTASMGTGFEFSAIAAVVIGGTSLYGGTGHMGGTLVGVLLIGVINNALNLLGVSAFYQDVVRGGVIFLAVLLDTLRAKHAARSDV